MGILTNVDTHPGACMRPMIDALKWLLKHGQAKKNFTNLIQNPSPAGGPLAVDGMDQWERGSRGRGFELKRVRGIGSLHPKLSNSNIAPVQSPRSNEKAHLLDSLIPAD